MLTQKFSVVLFVLKIVSMTLGSTDISFNCTIVADVDRSTCVSLNMKSFTSLTRITAINIEKPQEISAIYLTSKFMQFLPLDLFKFFKSVKELEVSTALPQISLIESKSFESASNLRSVHIIGQRLHTLGPNTFEGAPNIERLFLPSNQIESIDENAFDDLSKCTDLVLSNNRITALKPKTFKRMTSLRSINIGLNFLTTLEPSLFASNNLTVLDLSHNKISSLPEGIIDTFIKSQDDLKVLSLIGNVCNNEIYTKKSHDVKKSLEHCLNLKEVAITVPPEYQGEETISTWRTFVENKKISSMLKRNIVQLNINCTSPCSREDCLPIMGSGLDEGKNVIKALSSDIVVWKAKHKDIGEALMKWKQENSMQCPRPCITPENLKQLENEILSLMEFIKDFKKKNLQLSRNVDNLNKIVMEKVSAELPSEQCIEKPDDLALEPSSLLESSPENELNFVESNVSENIEEATEKDLEEDTEIEACNDLVEELKQQVKSLEAEGVDNDVSENCVESEAKIAELNAQAEEKDRRIARMSDALKLVTNEASKIDGENHENAVEKFELKEDIADCKTMRNVDSINIKSVRTKIKITARDEEMNDIMDVLEELFSSIFSRRDENSFELEDLVEQKVYEVLPARQVKDEVNELKRQVSARYKEFDENDEKFERILSDINGLIDHPLRRDRDHPQDIQESTISEKVNELNLIIMKQNQLLNNGGLGDYHLIHDTKVKLQPLNLIRRPLRRGGANTSVTDTMDQLQENVMEKDEILREKYRHVGEMVNQMKGSRADASKAIAELEKVKREASTIPKMIDALNDTATFIDQENIQENRECVIDKEKNGKTEQTIAQQLERIAGLEKDNEQVKQKLHKASKTEKELLKRCESCRGVWSKIKGWFVKKNNCDFLR